MNNSNKDHKTRCLVCGEATGTLEAGLSCMSCGFEVSLDPSGVISPVAHDGTATIGSREVAYPEEGSDLTMQIEDESFWFHHRNAVISALMDRYKPEGTLLDVGGGNGFQARHLQENGQPVVLIEPSPAGCRNAVGRGIENVLEGTLQAFAVPDHRIAALSMFDVLEHLADPDAMLEECRRVLKPGGHLYLTVPAYQALWSDEDIFARHERRYTRASLTRELERAGFEISYIGYYFRILVLPILLLRALPFRLRRSTPAEVAEMDTSEHLPSARARKFLDSFLRRELKSIRRGRELGYGSSLVAVAKAPDGR